MAYDKKAYQKKWREANPKKCVGYAKKGYLKNRDRILEQKKSITEKIQKSLLPQVNEIENRLS